MCVAHPEPLVDRLYFEVRTLLTSHVEKIYMVSVLFYPRSQNTIMLTS
jgi:hypothetical protein